MSARPSNDPPQHALVTASLAESLAHAYEAKGGNPRDLFVALAGIVAVLDATVAHDSLTALEGSIASSSSTTGGGRAA